MSLNPRNSCGAFRRLALPIIATCLMQVAPVVMRAATTPLAPVRNAAAVGPLRRSTENPRYFADSVTGKVVYLTGSHTWFNFQDAGVTEPLPAFDYTTYLEFLETTNHNFFRLWRWEQAVGAGWRPDAYEFMPVPYERTGPGNANDGKPKFDLTRFNQAYFDRLRERVVAAQQRGMYVSIMLFNGFSVERKGETAGNAWTGHPFNVANNINGINGDPDNTTEGADTHTLKIPAVTTLQEAFVRKVVDTVNDLPNVLYEISNESNSASETWQYHLIDVIHTYEAGLPNQHPVGMTVEYPNGSNADLFASPADWIAPNDVGGYKDNPPAGDGSKVIVSDTDHLWGVGGDVSWVWKSFTRGLNPILMDPYDQAEAADLNDPIWGDIRRNLGYTLTYANRMPLASVTPQNNLASTSYCLAHAASADATYLVYAPGGGSFSVNVIATPGKLRLEWLNPATGDTTDGGTVAGGATRTLNPPFSGDAVAFLTGPVIDPPVVTVAPATQAIVPGNAATLSVTATGDGTLTYQWNFDGVPLAGATAETYTIPSAQRFQAGSYSVTVTNSAGSVTSTAATVTIDAAAPSSSRLLNLSTRGLSQAAASSLIPGFVIQGGSSKRLLVRAVGPSLAGLGFQGTVIPDPHFDLKRYDFTNQTYVDVATNDDWQTNANAADIATTTAALQAFGLTSAKDAALLLDLAPGQYSVIAGDKTDASGIAIVELYDADPASTASRLVNISNRGFCGVGDEVLIPGFVISSEGSKTLLVRVVGPTLASAPFNVPGAMADPKLTLYRTEPSTGDNTELFSQDNWSDSADAAYTAQIATQVSAFSLVDGSKDAAFVVTLNPGVYTVVGSSANGVDTGIVLVEIYVVS